MRIIVTGGAGFIGSNLCNFLVSSGKASILNIDKLTYAANPASLNAINNHPGYQFMQADICDGSAVQQAFERFQPQAVMHLAAESHVDRSITGSDAFIQTNIVGTHNLLNIARSYWEKLSTENKASFRFLHISTDEVYGSLGAMGSFSETSPYNPSSPYSASKAASDHLVLAWHKTYGFPAIISNCSNNYGPYQFPEKLIPLMILNAMEGKALPIYGDGSNVRDWLHVSDHIKALWIILTKGRVGQTYNVGGGNEHSNLQVVHDICALMDELRPTSLSHSHLITRVTDRPGHDARYAINASKLTTELGWQAEENFESGLRKTIEWYLANKNWWQPLREQTYNGDRLGLIEATAS